MDFPNQDPLKLQDIITPEVQGVVWITKKNLTERPEPFDAIDYLMDGLLTKFPGINGNNPQDYAPSSKKHHKNNFFASNIFGKPFFVGQLIANSQQVKESLADLMKLISSLKQEKKSILVIDFSPESYISYLRKKYPEFKFFEVGVNRQIL